MQAQINIAGDQGQFSTIETQVVGSHSPIRNLQRKHFKAMSMVSGGEGQHISDFVSPYSVLRGSTDQDVDYALQKLQQGANASGVVMRSNRTQLLRHLQLKQKFDQNPFLATRTKLSREDAIRLGEDPHCHELSMQFATLNGPSARMRNKRGEYVSLQPGQSMPIVPKTAGDQIQKRKVSEARKAEQRLRRIEMISKYREDKIKKEFIKLEEDLRAEDERKKQQMVKAHRRKIYFQAN